MAAEVKLKANTKDYEKKMRRAQKLADNFSKKLDKATKSAKKKKTEVNSLGKSVGKFATHPAVLFTAAVGAFIGKTIAAAAALETVTIKFETLTGSVQRAQAHVKELTDFTARTPFQFEGVAAASARLQAFGFSVSEIMPKLKVLGDVASVTGSTIGELALIYGQVEAAGKLTGERLLQLQERQVPILKMLSKHFEITTGEVQKLITAGGVSSTTFQKVFDTLNQEGGYAFGGMEKQSNTLAGKISTLKDNFNIFAQEIGDTFLPASKKVTGWLISTLQKGTDVTKWIKESVLGIQKVKKESEKPWGKKNKASGLEEWEKAALVKKKEEENQMTEDLAKAGEDLIKANKKRKKKEDEADRIAKLEKDLRAIDDFDLLRNAKLSKRAQEDALIERNKDKIEKLRALKKNKEADKLEVDNYNIKKKRREADLKNGEMVMNHFIGMTRSKNKTLQAIGKIAAIKEIGINTAEMAVKSFNWASKWGGPIAGGIAAAAAIAFGVEQAKEVAGLYNGGTVMGGPGRSPYRDSVPARLAVKETVISKKVTEKIENMADGPKQETVINNNFTIEGNVIADDDEYVAKMADRLSEAVEDYNVRLVSSSMQK